MTTFPANNFQTAAQYLQATLNKYNNVKVNIVTESSQAHQSNCNTRSYDTICHYATPFDDPDPGLVNTLMCNAPEDHGAELAVADRQGVGPGFGGGGVPEGEGSRWGHEVE